MKIFSADQIRKWDTVTVKKQGIRSVELMERAGEQCTRWIQRQYQKDYRVVVICGPGNNGGDGLVIARLLQQLFYNVNTYVAKISDKFSDDFLKNKQSLEKLSGPVTYLESRDDVKDILIDDNTIILDAIFGSGLNRPASGFAAELIFFMNELGKEIISIDIPSGMFCEDNSLNNTAAVIKATHTLSFGSPKLSFYLPELGANAGQTHVLPIGLCEHYYRDTKTYYNVLQKAEVKTLLKRREKFTHKGTYGHVRIVAGSLGKMGAATLATQAALRAGSGLVTCHIPSCGYEIIQSKVAEAMVERNEGSNHLAGKWKSSSKAIGVGPGIGRDSATVAFLGSLLENTKHAIVIDADALNIISENPDFRKQIPKGSILTPHPKEFERLAGEWKTEIEKLQKLNSLAKELSCIIVFKDAHTIIVDPESGMYFNCTGNPGMATGGSGDVLTGVISALIAQSYEPLNAAMLGVYIHGLSGNIAAERKGEYSLKASDIIDCLSEAFLTLQ